MTKITGSLLVAMGYPQTKAIGEAIKAARTADLEPAISREILKKVLETPNSFIDDPVWGLTAIELLPKKQEENYHQLLDTGQKYPVFGDSDMIEAGAYAQMSTAMRLPIAVAGALMPDAHQGYGLPVGGVLATRNEVIPYGVGVDIGCRMSLSVYDLDEKYFKRHYDYFRKSLLKNTRFGRDVFDKPWEDEVMDRGLWNSIPLLRHNKDRAARQIGSSGSGNHFVEFGLIEVKEFSTWGSLKQGNYVALLSHSGSRGFGAHVARHYTGVAIDTCKLPYEAKQLAWLDLNTEAGQEYWMSMVLAGDYASACHNHIHQKISSNLGADPVVRVENHHNFAWREQLSDGMYAIVHRKGATPAAKGVLGIIPGSMSTPGYVVRGKGDARSLNSASHGAGRTMSRTQAKNTLNARTVKEELEHKGIELIGGGIDEAPAAYKNIHKVMYYQHDLVDVLAEFHPKLVRMCADETPPED